MQVEIRFSEDPIGRPSLPREASGETGAVVEFLGVVRGTEQGVAIRGLRYELYAPMAEAEIRKILEELSATYPCEGVCVVHRQGVVPVGESAIYVGICSKHRQSGFGMLAAFMDCFKARVPIWKVEVLPC